MKNKIIFYLSLIIIGCTKLTFAQPLFIWGKHLGNDRAEGRSIAVDINGNVYTTGNYTGTVDFDPGPGTYNLSSSGDKDIFISKLDAAGNFLWAVNLGGTGADIGYGITLDINGNVYTTGSFSNTADFDPGAGVFNLTAVGGSDIFVCKLSTSGNFVWAKAMGGTWPDEGKSITVDFSGNHIYTTGYFQDTVDFDPNLGVYNMGTIGAVDAFVSKLDGAGNFVWAKQMGGLYSGIPGLSEATGYGITLDVTGNVHIVGTFDWDVDFDPGAGSFYLSSTGLDVFVTKWDAAGNFIWAKQIGGSSTDYGYAIAVDLSGNVLTTGMFQSINCDFDPGAGTFPITPIGGTDVFISKLNAAGNFVWAKRIGGASGASEGRSITTDIAKNVYTTGYFSGTADMDPGPASYTLTSTLQYGAFINQLDSLGNFICAGNLGGYSIGQDIALDPNDNILTTGYFINATDFDPGTGTFNITSSGGENAYISKLASCTAPPVADFFLSDTIICEGACITFTNTSTGVQTSWDWSFTGGNPSSSTLQNPSAVCYANPGTYTISLIASNTHGSDTAIKTLFVRPILYSVNNTNICVGDSITLPGGNVVYTSGTYIDTLTSSLNCDSIITTNLWVSNPINTNSVITICAGQSTIIHGTAQSLPGIYSHTTSAIGGCDSISDITLVVNPTYSSNQNIGICAGSTFTLPGGTVVSTSGTYIDTLLSNLNCDSIITTNLTVGNPINTNSVSIICSGQSAIIHGIAQSVSGIYSHTTNAIGGCDSISVITLVISPVYNINQNVNICLGSSYTLPGGAIVSAAGTYIDTLFSILGCDSVITTALTTSNPIITNSNVAVCTGQSIAIHGINRSIAGVYSHTTSAIGGCDSISNVTLTINPASTFTFVAGSCDSFVYNNQTYTTGGIYTQTLSNSLGCDSIISIHLTIGNAVNTFTSTAICAGQSTLIHGVTQSTAGIYTQTFSAATSLGCDSISSVTLLINNPSTHTLSISSCNSYTNNSQTYDTSGVYTQTLINSMGCDSILTLNVTIHHPTPVFIGNDTAITPGTSLLIGEQNTSGTNTFLWNTGETSPLITVSPDSTSIYIITMTDSNGCVSSDTIAISIDNFCDEEILVPNGFSPNNDGQNDLLHFFMTGNTSVFASTDRDFYFIVYNRWGEKIFETNNPTTLWDGNYKNKPCDTGVYVYVLRYGCIKTNTKVTRRGNISLIR